MPLTILVVDDDPGIRISIGDYLELCGYSTIVAENGREALGLVEKYHPHLIVTDAIMPQMDGFELVRRVRQRPDCRLLPVIFLTAHNQTPDRIRGYQLGVDLYMPKPFELEEIGAVVRNLLDRYLVMYTAVPSGLPLSSPLHISPNSTTELPQDERLSDLSLTNIPELDLTKRERETLEELAKGLSNSEIGSRLYLSPRTIEKYVSQLLSKTDTKNRSELIRLAIEHHWVE
ncbi:response regulator transcription factor [Oscillatoriales cyanobacterium LEGE 11467]|uniref:Response regulator transcription factor n=1 Tax=Zarconia navalis LEGE 11467 TaxID=1828826 RepID=A0A928Z7Y7_9CYAN|nr:response regulator transcription factor [Zarconia navalis]MBE9039266.1 response regulator transcription factor [Zarconia navalis LEGE 11467]